MMRLTVAALNGCRRDREMLETAMKMRRGSFSTILRHRPNIDSNTSSEVFQTAGGFGEPSVVLAVGVFDE